MRRPWLAPFTPLYAAGLALCNLRIENGWEPVRRLRFPVVSIGNLSTGGAGKTPLTIALAKALKQRGFHVDVLSRGYGRRSQLPACVNPRGTAEDFGDEPLLIAREAGVRVYVAAQRYLAGLLAESEVPASHSPAIHLLDDGFQHRQLHRDVDILLLNREDWADAPLPAGNLREPLKALGRAGVIAIPADDPELEAELKAFGWQGLVLRLRRKVEVPSVAGPVAAFCGIARPQQFFQGLRSAGLHLAAQKAFSDHHRFTARDIDSLVAVARKAEATALITTEKDLVRLSGLTSTLPESLLLKTARLQIEIEDESDAIESLAQQIDP